MFGKTYNEVLNKIIPLIKSVEACSHGITNSVKYEFYLYPPYIYFYNGDIRIVVFLKTRKISVEKRLDPGGNYILWNNYNNSKIIHLMFHELVNKFELCL